MDLDSLALFGVGFLLGVGTCALCNARDAVEARGAERILREWVAANDRAELQRLRDAARSDP